MSNRFRVVSALLQVLLVCFLWNTAHDVRAAIVREESILWSASRMFIDWMFAFACSAAIANVSHPDIGISGFITRLHAALHPGYEPNSVASDRPE